MKQKNLLLVGVAVVCGLIAAFLTSQVSARTKRQAVETIDVPQAKIDIPIGTKIKADDFDKYVKIVKVPKDTAPQVFVEDVATMKDKYVIRTMRPDDAFNPADIKPNYSLQPPEGFSMMTVPTTLDKSVSGFVQPGVKVDILAGVKLKKSQRYVIFPLLLDVLVLAVDSNSAPPAEKQGFQQVSMISYAVDKESSLMLHGATIRGAELRCTLRHSEKPVKYDVMTNEEIWDILTDTIEEKEEAKRKALEKKAEPPKIELVKVLVPKADLVAGTPITGRFVAENFTEVEYPKGSVPENTAYDFDTEIKRGYYLLKDVAANHFVPKTFLGEKAAEPKQDEPKTAPPVVAKPVPPKKDYIEVTVDTFRGTVRHRYEKLPNGEYKYAGVVSTTEEPKEKDDKDEKKPDAEKSPIH